MTVTTNPRADSTAVPDGLTSLRFAPSTLVHLGERLVSNVDQGIAELVKNAYDADATTCTVSITADGLVISDDGVGMQASDLESGWLVLGRSGKEEKTPTERFSRVPVGDKGLGRLAALRLGRKATVSTRSSREPGIEHVVVLDWEQYARANTVEEVPLRIDTRPTDKPPGTDIEITPLRRALSRTELDRLARTLILLSDPFAEQQGFHAILEAPGFDDIATKVRRSYFEDAEYHVRGLLSDDGAARFLMMDWKGEVLAEHVGTTRPNTVPATFDLWIYLLDRKTFSTRAASLSDVREWLKIVGGVHVFEGPIRVPPYGERGVDWLEMNLRRAQSPEERPSTNNSVGRVVVDNRVGRLQQKTDRVGYIENEAFNELRDFAKEALDWAARVRLRSAERRREQERQSAGADREGAVREFTELLEQNVPAESRQPLQVAVDHILSARDREERRLRADLQLYRSLATAGMTAAVFAHEIGKPLGVITRTLPAMLKDFPEELKVRAQRTIGLAVSAAARLGSYAELPINLLRKEKRRPGRIDLVAVVRDFSKAFEPILSTADIKVILPEREEPAPVNGSVALVEGILANFFANSITAFERDGVVQPERQIRISIVDEGDQFVLQVADNAGGFNGIEVDEIWLPGTTTAPDGTGFGLTIVKDSVADLNGTIEAVPLSSFGGAEFIVRIPAI